jgi:adenosylmethionine-8-amino-7-oxononanoate aminotransferase
MIAGVEVEGEAGMGAKVCLAAREHGLLTRPILNTVVLMPPLCLEREEMALMGEAMKKAVAGVYGGKKWTEAIG